MNYYELRNAINRNFRIKVNGNGKSLLVGMEGLKKLIGYGRVIRLSERVLKSNVDIYLYKCHNGIRIRFYVK